jgi:hypothetical protein
VLSASFSIGEGAYIIATLTTEDGSGGVDKHWKPRLQELLSMTTLHPSLQTVF